MYREACTTDYLQRGGSNFDEQAHNYYRIRAGMRSSFDPLSPPAALYWSNAGQRSNDGDFSTAEAQGQHRSGTPVHLGSGAFVHPSRLSTMPPAPFNPPSGLRSGVDAQLLQTSPISSAPQQEVPASAPASQPSLRQVIRSQPRRPGQISAYVLISTSQHRRSSTNLHRAREIDTEHAAHIETENSHDLEIQNRQEVDRQPF